VDQSSIVALIGSAGIRLVRIADPLPPEINIAVPRPLAIHFDETPPSTRLAYPIRRFVRQDEHTYIEVESIGSIR
jgi:hypothetical protein